MASESLLLHLESLSAALDDGVDLGAVLAVLVDDLTLHTPSFLGLQLTLPTPGGSPITVTTLEETGAGPVRASLLLPLAEMGVAPPGGRVVFFAGAAGVFDDLAALAREEYGLDGGVVLDGHLEPDGAVPGVAGLTELDTVNQAIGVLIHHGHTPDEAAELIARRVITTGETPELAALALIAAPPPV